MEKVKALYENLFVVTMKDGEEATKALVEKFVSLIKENAEDVEVNEWGKRRLAYPINDETEGHYLFVEFTSTPEFPAELDRVYKITDGVLRSLIIAKVEA